MQGSHQEEKTQAAEAFAPREQLGTLVIDFPLLACNFYRWGKEAKQTQKTKLQGQKETTFAVTIHCLRGSKPP